MRNSEQGIYEIRCGRDCADDCQAHKGGIIEVTDERGMFWLVANHDTPAVEDIDGRWYNGMWTQVFEGPYHCAIGLVEVTNG